MLHASPRWRHGQSRGLRGREQGDGEGENRRGGGERGRGCGCGDSFVGGVAAALDNKDEDDGAGRWHKAPTNPMMVMMAVVADNDGDGGRRRQR